MALHKTTDYFTALATELLQFFLEPSIYNFKSYYIRIKMQVDSLLILILIYIWIFHTKSHKIFLQIFHLTRVRGLVQYKDAILPV